MKTPNFITIAQKGGEITLTAHFEGGQVSHGFTPRWPLDGEDGALTWHGDNPQALQLDGQSDHAQIARAFFDSSHNAKELAEQIVTLQDQMATLGRTLTEALKRKDELAEENRKLRAGIGDQAARQREEVANLKQALQDAQAQNIGLKRTLETETAIRAEQQQRIAELEAQTKQIAVESNV